MTADVRPKVLFIAGWQRSGTTLLGDMLGSTGGAQHVGELEYLRWPRHPSGLCGCGRPFEECEYWRPVLDSDFPFEEWHDLRYDTARSKRLPLDYWRYRRQGEVSRYARLQADLYRRIYAAFPQPIVDSSKRPSAAFAAVVSGEVDVQVLHVVRDPRAIAYSLAYRPKRHGVHGEGKPMRRRSIRDASLRWLVVHSAIERFVRPLVPRSQYLRLRYEDLVASPASCFDQIVTWAGIEQRTRPFLDETTVSLLPTHTAMGNPNRFSRGAVEVLPDTTWRTELPTREKAAVTAVTAPLLLGYGYRVVEKHGASPG
jgi:Sulfotransferase family